MGKVLSVNVGKAQPLLANNKVVQSGIFKHAVEGPVRVVRAGLEGDNVMHAQDGSGDRAVYAYPAEHYACWRTELSDLDLAFGTFGENLTTEGILDDQVFIGDRYQIGSAILTVTQPRMPCYKLAARLDRPDIIERMIAVRRHGFFFSVTREGVVNAGDTLQLIEHRLESITVLQAVALYTGRIRDPQLLERAQALEALPGKWKNRFAQRASA